MWYWYAIALICGVIGAGSLWAAVTGVTQRKVLSMVASFAVAVAFIGVAIWAWQNGSAS